MRGLVPHMWKKYLIFINLLLIHFKSKSCIREIISVAFGGSYARKFLLWKWCYILSLPSCGDICLNEVLCFF